MSESRDQLNRAALNDARSEPAPPPDVNAAGEFWTGIVRIRPTWCGCKLDELWELRDGRREWRRRRYPIEFQGRDR